MIWLSIYYYVIMSLPISFKLSSMLYSKKKKKKFYVMPSMFTLEIEIG